MGREGLLLFYYIDSKEPFIIPCEYGIIRHKDSTIIFNKKDGGSARVIVDKGKVHLILIHWYKDRCTLINNVLPSFREYFIKNNYTYDDDIVVDITYIHGDCVEYEILKK